MCYSVEENETAFAKDLCLMSAIKFVYRFKFCILFGIIIANCFLSFFAILNS